MTTSAIDPGVRQRLYLAGLNLEVLPSEIAERPQRAETAERGADTFTFVDRPFIKAGAPDVVSKYRWALKWPRVKGTDYQAFSRAEAAPGFLDFCLWKPVSEVFSGDASRTVFYLLRRNAPTVVPSGARPTNVTDYALKAWVAGSPVTAPTVGTADARGMTPVTFGSAPAAGVGNVEVFYTPLFYARIVDPSRGFPTAHREERELALEEI
jgi:hypothetical protein